MHNSLLHLLNQLLNVLQQILVLACDVCLQTTFILTVTLYTMNKCSITSTITATAAAAIYLAILNPFNASCSKLLLSEGASAILV